MISKLKELINKITKAGLLHFVRNDKIRKKVAFTLAEVLITLGIIGVVAALTLPTLLKNNAQKQTVVKVQRALAEMNQAYRLSQVDNGPIIPEEIVDMEPIDVFNTYLKPYFKVAQLCETYSDCGYKSWKPFYAPNDQQQGTTIDSRANILFKTASGFTYLYQTRGMASPPHVPDFTIYVDINGEKEPNRRGRDVFTFLLQKNNILPAWFEKTDDEVNNDCSKSEDAHGYSCAEKIRRDGWKISKDYPW